MLHLDKRSPPPATGAIVQEGTGADLLKSDMIRKTYLGMVKPPATCFAAGHRE